MPTRIEPCLAKLVPRPPRGSQWSFEIKWDGYRLAIHIDSGKVRCLTKGGHDWTALFPAIAAAASSLSPQSTILDGEVVVLDRQGRSDFGALQRELGGKGRRRQASNAIFYAFDLLYFDGQDLRRQKLGERRKFLESVLPGPQSGAIRLSEEIAADGETFFRTACEFGLEGIIAKRRDLPYRSGRKGDWLKIKCVQSETFAVIGYEPATAQPGAIKSLLLAAVKAGKLVYVGSVGTGFKAKDAYRLRELLDIIRTKEPPARSTKKTTVYVEPTLLAEIAFRAWTSDRKLRHTSFKGLRDPDDDPKVFVIEG
jgi:bifunctional non-homologous end joining protein LigD